MTNVHNLADEQWKRKQQLKPDGTLLNTSLSNFELVLANMPPWRGRLRYNQFTMSPEISDGGKPREMTATDAYEARKFLQSHGLKPTERETLAVINAIAETNGYHPVRDYLASLQWDNEQRLDHWLHVYFGAKLDALTNAMARKFLISAVARVMQPGCRVDNMLVIEGDQGIGKSGGIMALFGEQFASSSPTLFHDHKRMVIAMTGQWCIELAEFAAVKKSEIDQVKALISTPSDRVVLNYANFATSRARQCVFMGTINPGETGYLTDTTGNRRFWIVEAKRVDWEGLKRDRDQIWAEALLCYQSGEQWHLTVDEAAEAEDRASSRMRVDPWVERLRDKINATYADEFTTQEAYEMLSMGVGRDQDPFNASRLGACLKQLGFRYQSVRVPPHNDVAKRWKLAKPGH